ncbi:PTS fructose transporter subunit IIB [Thermohalobacter berrensis]|uniref:PTS fructose transporter subunit IIB n=1 Tax=Thermohalobacter berrensis TaxID=99594 RepID=A0A419T2V8_9FIRM|nr:fructose PTS transporter subunit IIB [Thermohalobacter berrensis]RKD31795.1 PTS fructose transporter subunit IIB [Thermohalobacter berrensis]
MKIVAVTACPAGIAHTNMAASAIENAAKKRGIEIKVEKQGALGLQNEITSKDIEEADVAILSVATKVEKESRFDSLPVYKVKIDETLKNPEKVIEDALKLIK